MSIGQASVNKVILVANLGHDPEVKETSTGIPVTSLSIATNEIWQDKDGNAQTRTEWHRVVLWRKQAEVAGKYLKKGSKIYIEGSLRTRNWEDGDGNKHTITEVLVDKLTMLDSKANEGADQTASERNASEVAEVPAIEEDDLSEQKIS